MGSPEHVRSYSRRDNEDISGVKGERDVDDEEYEENDKRKHRSSKTRKPSNGEDTEGLSSSGRRRSSGDRSESRKRTGGSSRADSDEDDFGAKRDRSKQLKKSKEESSLEKLSSWYQDGDIDGGDKLGGRGHGRTDEPERRRVSSKFSDHDSSQSKHRSREERYNDGESERMLDKDSRYSERRESSREKVQGSSENVKTPRKKWDESDAARKTEENGRDRVDLRSGKSSDSKRESGRERSMSTRVEQGDGRSGDMDSNNEKAFKSGNKEDRKVDTDRIKGKGKVESQEDDFRSSPRAHEERPDKEKNDKYRQQGSPSRYDVAESRERSFNPDEEGSGWSRDKNVKELGHSNRSRTPERNSRRHQDTELSEMDNDRNIIPKRKEVEKDGYRDDRSKGRDGSWSERNRDREGSSDSWKRRQLLNNDKDVREGVNFYDHGREWEIQRHGHERNDNERHHGRPSGRKDGNRGEAVKTSSNFGISNENYDVIEIQTKPIDYVRTDSGSAFSRRGEGGQFPEPKSAASDDQRAYTREAGRSDMSGSGPSADDSKEQNTDDGTPTHSQAAWRDENEMQGSRGRGQKAPISTGLQSPFGSQDQGSFNRVGPQGMKGNRLGRGGRGRLIGRDDQQVGIPLPIMGSPFGPLGMPPPGPMASLNPNMSPAPGPPMSPSVFMPPFTPPVVWPGARGMDMNMLAIPPGLSPVPPGQSGPRFPPNMGTPPTSAMYFNQAVSGRGVPSNMSGPGINAIGQGGRGGPHDKASESWAPPKSSGPPGKAPSRGEQNDYSQNFVDTGMRPQNFIRELELTNVVEDYPKLRELIQKKDDIVRNSNAAPMFYKCDLREHVLSSEFFGTKFDVILVDPPWEEYVHRAPGLADHMEYWTFEEIMNLKIEAIADTPSFIFLWVGDGVGLEQGRQCLKKWGFRRCEDICWVKTNKNNSTPSLRHDSHTLFQHSKEHCLMGIKGTVRRSTDGHIIHANIDTDVIIAEEPDYGSTKKPEDMYRIVEHFSLGRRRLELFGEDHNIRPGWLTVGKGLSSSNFNSEAYIRNFCDKDGKVWLGGGGRNPPPESPHLVLTTPDIEALRPKSPMKNQQQLQQQQSTTISINTNSSGKRPTGNSPQNPSLIGLMNQETSGSNTMNTGPWAPPMDGFKGGNMGPEEKLFESTYGYNTAFMQASGEYMDFEAHRAMNLL